VTFEPFPLTVPLRRGKTPGNEILRRDVAGERGRSRPVVGVPAYGPNTCSMLSALLMLRRFKRALRHAMQEGDFAAGLGLVSVKRLRSAASQFPEFEMQTPGPLPEPGRVAIGQSSRDGNE
jgi:hypothetical protein